jgi:predicted metalloprotease with PDZ domain
MDAPNFQKPLVTDLLWVYEGLTEYYGWLLGARAGTVDAEEARDDLARVAASQGARTGRRWRPLVDTAVAASLLNTAPGAWSSYRRGQDYYGEGQLVWLEADALIRTRSNGRKSLDDFTRAFFGIAPGAELVVPYTRAELVQALNGVQPYDWETFFATRVDSVRVEAPLRGIEQAGWSLAWRDSSSDYFDALDEAAESSDYRWSLGFRVGDGGTLADVIPDSPAARAGLAPGAKLLAIEGREFSNTVLKDALLATRPAGADSTKGPSGRTHLEVISSRDGFVQVSRIEYAGGPRYPVLKRRVGTADLMARILARKRK